MVKNWRLPALILGPTAFIFLAFELVERQWLGGVDMEARHALYMARGIAATLVVSGLVAWHLTRQRADFPRKIASEAFAEPVDYIDWFISLRWLAILCVATAVFSSQHILHLLPPDVTAPLWGGAALLLVTNVVFLALRDRVRNVRVQIRYQIAGDLLLLTSLLHFAGGIENPFLGIYVFHVILASILLPRREAFLVTAGVCLVICGLAFGEYAGLVGHYTVTLYPHERDGEALAHAAHQLPYVFGVTGAMIALMTGTVYFTTSVVERLRESHRHLLRSERLSALGQLVAYVAHEVNNPIGIISTRAKLARARVTEPDAGEFLAETLEIVDRQAERVAGVVTRLLRFSRAPAPARDAVDLNAAIRDALSFAEGRMARCGIVLQCSLDRSLSRIQAGYNDLVHVFLNLVNNAIDAMPHGGRLRVRTAVADGWDEATVSDTGDGIPRRDLPNIFDPFFTTKPMDRGTGLGLPISLSIVKGLGGEIRVESATGSGTSFCVRLPVERPEEAA